MPRKHRSTLARLALAALAVGVTSCKDVNDVVGPSARTPAPLAFAMNAVAAIDTNRTFFGPIQFARTAGAPNVYANSISTIGYIAPFTLHVRNGDANGNTPASSATISLDGVVLMSPTDFKKHKVDYSFAITPGVSTALQIQMAGSDSGFVTIWIDGKEHDRFCPAATGDGLGYQTLQQALDTVTPTHTVWVCNGAHIVNEALVAKALTLRAENAGMATLVQSPSAAVGDAVLDVTGAGSGKDAFVDLGLQFTYIGMHLHGAFDSVTVIRSSFTGSNLTCGPNQNTGLLAEATTVATAYVGVHRSVFANSCVGLSSNQPVNFDTYNSTFGNFGTFGLVYSSANSASQNPNPTGVPIARTGRAIGNTFTNCGLTSGACVAIEVVGIDTVSQNHMTMTSGRITDGIFVNRSGEPAGLSGSAVITNNVIEGAPRTGPDSASTSWSYVGGIVETPGFPGVVDVIQGNRISGVYAGVEVRGAGVLAFSDNTIDTTYVGILTLNGVAPLFAAHRNDFSNYTVPMANAVGGFSGALAAPALPVGSATCNWWGGNGGPTNVVSGTPVTVYAPYSTTRIAGKSSVSCDPGAAVTTVRACPTTNNSGFPTLPTIQAAYAAVPNGGTVLVCDGSFVVSDFQIAKAVTIIAEGPRTPTVDAGGGNVAFSLLHVATGPVTISKLHFTSGVQGQVAIRAVASTRDGAVTNITQNVFDVPHLVNPTGGQAAAAIYIGSLDSATINIDSNTFNGGDGAIGTSTTPGVNVTVRWNTFAKQTLQALAFSNFDPSATYDLENNVFVDCASNGTGSCASSTSHVTIANNVFTVHIASPTSAAISVGIQNGDLGTSTIANNTILGIGTGSTDRTQSSAYAFPATAIWLSNAVAVVSGNHITNAYEGVRITNTSAVTAYDNVIQKTFAVWRGYGSGGTVLTANWNDFSDYIVAFNQAQEFALSVLNVRCNWWGQATGPAQMDPNVPVAAFTPFATAAVAGQSHTGCTP